MKKIRYFLLRVILITGLVLFLFTLFSHKGYETTIMYDGELKSDLPTIITIENTLDQKKIQPENLSVEIYNEYNKSQYFEFNEIPSVNDGTYKLIVSPDSPGKHIINVTYVYDGIEQKYSEEFILK